MPDYVLAAEIAAKAGARAAKAGGRATRYASQLASAAVLKVIDSAFPPPFLNDVENVLAADAVLTGAAARDRLARNAALAAEMFPQHNKTPDASARMPRGAVSDPAAGAGTPPAAAVEQRGALKLVVTDALPPHVHGLVYDSAAFDWPTPEFDWVTWAIPAIADALADHKFLPIMGRCECPSLPKVADWQRWCEHVAPLIAARIQLAASKQ